MENSFGVFIKNIRTDKGITLKKLEEKSGVSIAQISRLENGTRKSPRAETVKALADALEISHKSAMAAAGYVVDEEVKENEEKTLTNEQRFLKDIELDISDEELLDKYPINFDGLPLSPEEAKVIISIVRAKRSSNDQ
ncbi:helix-turn-helix domain-containing protein [Shouchella patagoniensis]|uniref:helix-turn-helix domain-containing protein n=1 Tax=Shouchella patagoniensis TaxID=228576 RepID=UPI000994FD03|nr:helix-turn-helix transcriptional regulator [Shouchella patagoniensis]